MPAFFDETSRSLDAPANGVTSAFLYGAAIWPVYLTARHGDDVVRAILAREAVAGDHALVATDAILAATESSTLAAELSRFATWNASTGTRAGTGGYPNAASYPSVHVAELTGGQATGITSGYASFYFHATASAPSDVSIATDPARNVGVLLPIVDGRAQPDRASSLPASFDGEAIIVVSGISASKTDAPFTISIAPSITPSDAGDAGVSGSDDASVLPLPSPSVGGHGCSFASSPTTSETMTLVALVALVAFAVSRRSARVLARRAT